MLDELDVSLIKPVLRRKLIHETQHVIVTFKSFEIWPIQTDTDGQVRVMKPVYVPTIEAMNYMDLSVSLIETKVCRSLKLMPNGRQF